MKKFLSILLAPLIMTVALDVAPAFALDYDVMLTITPDKKEISSTDHPEDVVFTISVEPNIEVDICAVSFKLQFPEGMTYKSFEENTEAKSKFTIWNYNAAQNNFAAAGGTQGNGIKAKTWLLKITAAIDPSKTVDRELALGIQDPEAMVKIGTWDAKPYNVGLASTPVTILSPAPHNHEFSTDWKYDSKNHWHECSCGAKADVSPHIWKWVIDKEATETEAGSKHQECEICGYKKQLGDVNGDGEVNIRDARWLLHASSCNMKLTDEQTAVADVNGDGKVNVIDARWVLQASSGNRTL